LGKGNTAGKKGVSLRTGGHWFTSTRGRKYYQNCENVNLTRKKGGRKIFWNITAE